MGGAAFSDTFVGSVIILQGNGSVPADHSSTYFMEQDRRCSQDECLGDVSMAIRLVSPFNECKLVGSVMSEASGNLSKDPTRLLYCPRQRVL